MTDAGPAPGSIEVAYEQWLPAGESLAEARRPVVVLIHGSPGAGADFWRMGALLADAGYRVIAPDLPGFGRSGDQPSLSTLAHARSVLALMDALQIRRAHLVGWSLGGGVILNMERLAAASDRPEQIATLTLLASVGRQANEGSGSYFVEHLKYKAGKLFIGYGLELVPHFGLLGDHRFRMNTLRNFDDSDFRQHDAAIEELRIPLLIYHGRHDMLAPVRAAEDHYRRTRTSSLWIVDTNHFIAMIEPQARDAVAAFVPFFSRHDRAGVVEPRQRVDLGGPLRGSAAVWRLAEPTLTGLPWWLLAVAAAGLTLVSPLLAATLCAVLADGQVLDYGVAIIGISWGFWVQSLRLVARGRRLKDGAGISRIDWTRRFDRGAWATAWDACRSQFVASDRREMLLAAGALRRGMLITLGVRAIAAMAWATAVLLPCMIAARLTMEPLRAGLGAAGVMLAVLITAGVGAAAPLMLTRRGRQHVRRKVARIVRREYWLAWWFYLPLVPLLYRTLRGLGGVRRTFMAPTAVNPGMEGAGGFIGESKVRIMDALTASVRGSGLESLILPTILIEPGDAAARMERLLTRMEDRGIVFPIVLKPDSGYRGFGVRVIRDQGAALKYLGEVRTPVIAQMFHPGPHECGICWVRDVPARTGERAGSIFSVTRKEFPVIEGDGRRTLEELVWAHRRFRNQAPVFMARLADQRSWVPAKGERVRLAMSGNHCQGTLFRDGADLITPELEESIDRLARSFTDRGVPEGLDCGRFDLRYSDEAQLRAGRGFAIVELNGALGESTNLYDPDKSIVWSYGVLVRQWKALYRLGVWRKAAGFPAITLLELIRRTRAHVKSRSGSALAD